ncbi:discoidin domain-containing protein [Fulvivirga ligni]|uniref:discoidin domain-containing protein n=1 Tax=Fulvivirga ligni TaxID=2904246 RepID=UPI001F420B45|nr:discoidin domain-containing protein [Fulvivirga ligni]UII19544.1 discoidin domain-containing protein [Fulvivirga ligni]
MRKGIYILLSITLSFLLFCCQSADHSKGEYTHISLNSDQESVQWKVYPQDSIGKDSLNIFAPDYNTDGWVKAVVPGAVFTSYVEAGIEKDPNFGDNIYQVDKKLYDRNFWYRTELKAPESYKSGKTWLNFEGVNRKADVFFNGKLLGKLDGFMDRGHFDITDELEKEGNNVLAVLVYWPTLPIPNLASPTYISSASWDWMPYVPGLLMGITDDVYLSNSGDVTIHDPWIRTKLEGQKKAHLTIQTEVQNNAGEPVKGTLKGFIKPGNIEFSQEVTLAANERKTIAFTPSEFTQLNIDEPQLWWPNGYGDQPLYTCDFEFSANNEPSDYDQVTFGIREYGYDSTNHAFHLLINGEKIFVRGGNWGMSEYMLRCRGEEYETKLRLHKELNFNMIRNWIGSTTDEEFYKACDKYGIMVWDDFWLNSHPNLPTDIDAFSDNAIQKIKRYRNYASVALWCGDNEASPQPPLDSILAAHVAKYDAGDRRYQSNSRKGGGFSGSGPWTNADPKVYFSGLAGFNGDENSPVKGFRSEVGTAVFTTFESFKKFMPKEDWWPRNEMWNKHFFGKSAANGGPDTYEQSINERYGQANGIEDWCRKAQLLNLETNKAMYEGWRHDSWDKASGILTWMSQSAYPSFVWQTYDYYYDLNGAFWGARRGSEPVHIQWSASDNSVKVLNSTREDLEGVTAEIAVYDPAGKPYEELGGKVKLDAPANGIYDVFKINFNVNNLAANAQAVASSTSKDAGDASSVSDASSGTRWSSSYDDDNWVYVDLGEKKSFTTVRIYWESAFAKAYKLQLSDDAKNWKDVYQTTDGNGSIDHIQFLKQEARYVRMKGKKRATDWGYSIFEIEVYGESPDQLDPVHFIKLKLTDKEGNIISDNFYWRGSTPLDYTAINDLPKAHLEVNSAVAEKDGNYLVNAEIMNPKDARGVALAIRVKLVNSETGEQYLPTFKSDSYFSLLPGESKKVQLEIAKSIIGKDTPKLVVEPYNN